MDPQNRSLFQPNLFNTKHSYIPCRTKPDRLIKVYTGSEWVVLHGYPNIECEGERSQTFRKDPFEQRKGHTNKYKNDNATPVLCIEFLKSF